MANLIFSFVCLLTYTHYFTYTTKYTFAHTAAAFGWILDTGNNDKIGLYRIIWERFGSHVYRTPNLYSRNVNRTQRTLNSYSKHTKFSVQNYQRILAIRLRWIQFWKWQQRCRWCCQNSAENTPLSTVPLRI